MSGRFVPQGLAPASGRRTASGHRRRKGCASFPLPARGATAVVGSITIHGDRNLLSLAVNHSRLPQTAGIHDPVLFRVLTGLLRAVIAAEHHDGLLLQIEFLEQVQNSSDPLIGFPGHRRIDPLIFRNALIHGSSSVSLCNQWGVWVSRIHRFMKKGTSLCWRMKSIVSL